MQDGDKSRHAERGASNVHIAGSSRSLTRAFTRCKWIEGSNAKRATVGGTGGGRKMNLKPQKPLIGMIFEGTNADLRGSATFDGGES